MRYDSWLPPFTPAYRFDVEWRGMRVTSSWFRTNEECLAAKAAVLESMGYSPKRWWQFWRWGEDLTPKHRRPVQPPLFGIF